MDIFDIWCTEKGLNAQRSKNVANRVQKFIEDMEETIDVLRLTECTNYICKKVAEFWSKCGRSKEKTVREHSEWLYKEESIALSASDVKKVTGDRGRPKIDFVGCSKRTKRRRVAEISKIDDTAASFLRSSEVRSQQEQSQANVEEVLSLLVEVGLTKHQYLLIRTFINLKAGFDLLPSYEKILLAKSESYPDGITISESMAEVELQSLLDHTASRILQLQKETFQNFEADSVNSVILIGKWGFDGSTGHAEYKQKTSNPDLQDNSLFVTSYVPLRIITKSKNPQIIWKNPRPSSTRYCRPIRFQFKKETTELSIEEEQYFQTKIDQLKSTIFATGNRKILVEHSLQLTMVDGKICNALTETSSAKCYICEASPTQMNNLEECLLRKVHEERFEFGLSPLHAYIRFFEYFIHVSYRLDLQIWQIRSEEAKKQYLIRKQFIQSEFRQKMGLIVDKPKAGGSGTSNDGNTARKFFDNPDVSADITGLDKELILRCATLLQALSSGYSINPEKFGDYALKTAKGLVEKYPWYYLSPSVHKILLHAPSIIRNCLVSIGELSEEAAEARNKDIKMFRLKHTRKISRVLTNTDLFNRLFLSSDPLISGQRQLPCKQKSKLLKSAIELLE